MTEKKKRTIELIRQNLLKTKNFDDAYMSMVFPDFEIEHSFISQTKDDRILVRIDSPFSTLTGESFPMVAMDYVVFKNGSVYCRTERGIEYNLNDLFEDSVLKILAETERYISENL